MADCVCCITLHNDLSELRKFAVWINEMGKQLGLHPDLIYKLDVCADEALMNIMTHAYDAGDAYQICVRLLKQGAVVSLEIKDTGKEFVPIYTVPPLEGLSLAEAPIGGLGIHLMHKLMDECRYTRYEGVNTLILSTKIAPLE